MHRFQRVLDQLADRVDTPAPIVLLDVMQRNIDRMQAFASEHGLEVRPHVKTHKCIEIGRLQLDAGATGITAGSVALIWAVALNAQPLQPISEQVISMSERRGRKVRRMEGFKIVACPRWSR